MKFATTPLLKFSYLLVNYEVVTQTLLHGFYLFTMHVY